MKGNLTQLDIAALFHSILFAHQKAVINMSHQSMNERATNYMIPYLDKVFEKISVDTKSGSVEGLLTDFGDMLVNAEAVENSSVEKEERVFRFTVDGCVYANHVHGLLNPSDVTCPYGLIAYYLAEKKTGFRVKKGMSQFTEDGSATDIEFELELSHI